MIFDKAINWDMRNKHYYYNKWHITLLWMVYILDSLSQNYRIFLMNVKIQSRRSDYGKYFL